MGEVLEHVDLPGKLLKKLKICWKMMVKYFYLLVLTVLQLTMCIILNQLKKLRI